MKRINSLLIVILFLLFSTSALADSDGRKTVTTAGTAEALSVTSALYTRITICAETDNTGVIAVGISPVAALGTREGIPLNAGDCYSPDRPGNLAALKIDTTVDGDGVTFHYEN